MQDDMMPLGLWVLPCWSSASGMLQIKSKHKHRTGVRDDGEERSWCISTTRACQQMNQDGDDLKLICEHHPGLSIWLHTELAKTEAAGHTSEGFFS